MNGLRVYIIGPDFTAGGITSGKDSAVVVNTSGPVAPSDDAPALYIIDESPEGMGPGFLMVRRDSARTVRRVRVVPFIDGKPVKGGMFGGRFVTTSDSRFPFHGPLPVFDRFEN